MARVYKPHPPKKKQPFYACFKVIMRRIFKRPEIINLAGELAEKSIVIANHSNKSGPPSLDLYYPKRCYKWGHYLMFGTYKERKAYLRDVLYIQKCGRKPGFKTSFVSGLLAFFSRAMYKGMRMMPSYPDARLARQLKDSCKFLDANYSIMVFPENSNEGYKDVLTEFFPGFVMLSDSYYKQTGEDLPVYPVYYSIKKRLMVIGKPLYLQEMAKEGLNRYQIAEKCKDVVNQLYFDYVENYQKPEKRTKTKK